MEWNLVGRWIIQRCRCKTANGLTQHWRWLYLLQKMENYVENTTNLTRQHVRAVLWVCSYTLLSPLVICFSWKCFSCDARRHFFYGFIFTNSCVDGMYTPRTNECNGMNVSHSSYNAPGLMVERIRYTPQRVRLTHFPFSLLLFCSFYARHFRWHLVQSSSSSVSSGVAVAAVHFPPNIQIVIACKHTLASKNIRARNSFVHVNFNVFIVTIAITAMLSMTSLSYEFCYPH